MFPYWCDPDKSFNAQLIETSYSEFLVHSSYLYDPAKGILRCCKRPFKSSTNFVGNEMFTPIDGDRDDQIWEADDPVYDESTSVGDKDRYSAVKNRLRKVTEVFNYLPNSNKVFFHYNIYFILIIYIKAF